MMRFRFRARGKRPKKKEGMNQWETDYAAILESKRATGEVVLYRYEAVKLRLADKTFYTCDFMVMLPDGVIEFHEVKGHWEEDARLKIKLAAEQFPEFTFRAFLRRRKEDPWTEEVFGDS